METKNKFGWIFPLSIGGLAILLMSFGFKSKKKPVIDNMPPLDSNPPAGSSGGSVTPPNSNNPTSPGNPTVSELNQLYAVSYNADLVEKPIKTKVATYYNTFSVQYIDNGSQLIVTAIDKIRKAVNKDTAIGMATGYIIKDRDTGEVYMYTVMGGVNMVTPLADTQVANVTTYNNPTQSGIYGSYTYYFDNSYKGKNLYAGKATLYQSFNASFKAGPNGGLILMIGNISAAKTWNKGNFLGQATGYIIQSGGKKYVHTIKNGVNYATLI